MTQQINYQRKTPPAIIDNLDQIGDPFKLKHFDIRPFFEGAVASNAETDYEYALKFLYSYQGSKATFNSYRREVERLLQWAWRIEHVSILSLKREHIEAYVNFCINPPAAWIGTANVARFKNKDGLRVPNPKWHPFTATLSKEKHRDGHKVEKSDYEASQASIKATFAILSSFYDFLCQEELLESNPVMLIRQKSKFIVKQQGLPTVRRLSNLQWEYVIETAEILADQNPDEHERTLFIMNCLYAMYLRISELAADERSIPLMSHFKRDHDQQWWFHVTGKGNKTRKITVSDAMLNALKRYRKFRGLSPLPASNDIDPLIPKKIGKGAMSSTRHLRKIVQDCFDQAYERMKADNLEMDATDLRAATVHWLRHTGISEDVKIRPREHVRDDAGHQSMQTTDRYIESDDRERHRSGRKKTIKD